MGASDVTPRSMPVTLALDDTRRRALRTRAVLSPILLGAVVGIYLLDVHVTGGRTSAALLGLVALGGLYEYVRMMRGACFPVGRSYVLAAAAVLHALPFFFTSWGSVDAELYPPVLMTVVLVFVMSVRALARSHMGQGLEELGSTLLGFVLLTWPFYLAQGLALRSMPALLYLVLVSKSGDIGGYCVGVLFGRRKLIPHVSPGKSVEGAAGSLALAVVVAVALRGPLLDRVVSVSLWTALGIGALVNVTTQLGDLVESLLKRRCNVKDSSHLLPEHGGLLDLVDSLLFSVPAFFFVLVRLT